MADSAVAAEVAPMDLQDDAGTAPADAPMDDDFEFDTVGKEIKLTEDGGVIKKVITPGEGWESPEKGDEVTVHYVGTLVDGSPFDSSRERDEPFVFPLGEGRVIKGWDTGVATMKRGEKSLLICRSDYAYGPAGSPPKIPANATLHFEVELLSWKSNKDISGGDGGIIKTVTTEGSGWETCQDKYEAKVSYVVRVAGSEAAVASADDLVFTVGEGHLIPALPVAVKTMKKGEAATLAVKPEYGFGAAGSAEHGVGPNAALEVDLTLNGWNHIEHVTPSGSVVKKVLKANEEEYRKPNEGATVTLRITGKLLPDGTVFVRHGEGEELTFVPGEEQLVEGLEQAVLLMKRGEVAEVTITDPALGYGAAGWADAPLAPVPPGASLLYEVELVEFDNAKESWEMSDPEKVEAARAIKDKGNAFFKAGRLAKAAHQWERAVSLVQFDKSFPEDVKTSSKELKRSCWLNLAALDVKEARWAEALKHCNSVLELEGSNVKALYRRAQAQMGLADFFEAEQDLKKALSLEPDNKDVAALMRKMKVGMKEQNKEASLYSKMFKPTVAKAQPAVAPAAEGSEAPAPAAAAADAVAAAPAAEEAAAAAAPAEAAEAPAEAAAAPSAVETA